MSLWWVDASTFSNRLNWWQKNVLNEWIDYLIYDDLITNIKDLPILIDEAILNFDDVLENEILNCSEFMENLDHYTPFIEEYLKENGGTI